MKTGVPPPYRSLGLSCFLLVPVAFAAPHGRRILGRHIPATFIPCNCAQVLVNFPITAVIMLSSLTFLLVSLFFWVHFALPFYAYDASVVLL